jgi:hypothetical protein
MSRLNIPTIIFFASLLFSACDDNNNETVLVRFLSEHDPSLKSKRDSIVFAIKEIEGKRDQLRSAKKQYKSNEAQAEVDGMIKQVDKQLDQMRSNLAAIDSKIELAMVERDFRNADAGGLLTQEFKELSENADSVLNQAGNLRELLADDERGVRKNRELLADHYAHSPQLKAKAHSDKTQLKIAELKGNLAALDAKIATEKRRWQESVNLINRLTNFKRTPVVEGSQQYYECLRASRVIQEVEAGASALKSERERIAATIKSIEN